MTKLRLSASVSALVLSAALVLTGCAAPIAPPTEPGTTDPGTTDPGQNNGTGEFVVDPAYPWPAEYPRPNNIVGEFSGKNPLGEGGVRSIDFMASKAEAEAYVKSLLAVGWEAGFGMSDEPTIDDGGNSISWLLTTDSLMGTVSTENGNDAQALWSFAILG